jgi:hypothetical protein
MHAQYTKERVRVANICLLTYIKNQSASGAAVDHEPRANTVLYCMSIQNAQTLLSSTEGILYQMPYNAEGRPRTEALANPAHGAFSSQGFVFCTRWLHNCRLFQVANRSGFAVHCRHRFSPLGTVLPLGPALSFSL